MPVEAQTHSCVVKGSSIKHVGSASIVLPLVVFLLKRIRAFSRLCVRARAAATGSIMDLFTSVPSLLHTYTMLSCKMYVVVVRFIQRAGGVVHCALCDSVASLPNRMIFYFLSMPFVFQSFSFLCFVLSLVFFLCIHFYSTGTAATRAVEDQGSFTDVLCVAVSTVIFLVFFVVLAPLVFFFSLQYKIPSLS